MHVILNRLYGNNVCFHEFSIQLINITSNNQWCSFCVNKTELKLLNELKIFYPEIQTQFRVDWCKNKYSLPFDFVIHDLKIIIELDGIQHFKQISNWKMPEEQQKIDLYKTKCANDNEYSVIRILQEDVWNNNFDYITEINYAIIKILRKNKIQNRYICQNNEYKEYNTKIVF